MAQQVLTEEIILAAIDGLSVRRDRLNAQIEDLQAMLPGSRTAGASSSQSAPAKRKFSREALERIRAGQRKRWAKIHEISATPTPPKRKRRLSAAGRKAISEAAKKRWGAVKKAGSPAATKSGPRKGAKKAAKTVPASTAQAAD